MIMRSMKKLLFVSTVVFVMAFAVVKMWRYIDLAYLSIKDAESIYAKLTSNDPEQIKAAAYEICGFSGTNLPDGTFKRTPIPNSIELRGAGEAMVKQRMLDILASTTNMNVISSLLYAGVPDRGGVDLPDDEEARKTIQAAMDRYNAAASDKGWHAAYKLKYGDDGRWFITLGRWSY